MSLTNNLKILTKTYYDTQNTIDLLNKKIQEIRNKKKDIEYKLINEMSNNGLQNQAITYQGKKIYMTTENSYDTLSFKFLEECLLKLFNNNNKQVKEIIKFIKSQRKKTINNIVKIS
jgi:hypothetical protein